MSMNVFCAEVPLVMSVKWYICSARGCSMRLSKLYNFRDSHLLYCLYVFLSSVILWYMEALGLQKFLTKGQTWNPKCLHSQLVYQLYLRLFQGIFLYNFESVHQVCAYTLEFLGGMRLLQKLESTWKYSSKPSSSSPIAPPQLLSSFVWIQFCWGHRRWGANDADNCARDSGRDFEQI